MRKFKHKITGKFVEKTTSGDFYVNNHELIPCWCVENSNDWEEIIEKDYEVLEYKSIQGIHCEKGQYFFDVVSQYGNPNEWFIYKIRRKSDGVEFKIGDKICGTSSTQELKNASNYKGYVVIKAIVSTTEKRSKSGFKIEHCTGTSYWLENLNLYKEPILTTEDGYECTLDDRVFGVLPKANWQTNFYDGNGIPIQRLIRSEGFPNTAWLYFKTKENAEKYIYENKPEFSKRQIRDRLGFWVDKDVIDAILYDLKV